jgi:hypothetical protein
MAIDLGPTSEMIIAKNKKGVVGKPGVNIPKKANPRKMEPKTIKSSLIMIP